MISQPSTSKFPAMAACGLDCGECPIGKAARDRAFAEKLAQEWRESGNQKATADWFKCEGCHGREDLVWAADCKIRACCIKTRHLDNCSVCVDFPCPLIDKFEQDGYEHHSKAVQRLKQLHASRSS